VTDTVDRPDQPHTPDPTPDPSSASPDRGDGGAGGDTGHGGDLGHGDEVVPGRGRVGLIVSAVVAVLAVAFVAVLATSDPATERRAKSPLVGKIAPALVGETLAGGGFDIDDHRGQWVVVNFFATWCPPCVEEHPELIAFDEAHRAAGDAVVVSVVYSDQTDDVRDFFAERGGEWAVVADGGRAATDYGVAKVPETYLVAPGGQVAQKYTGGVTRDLIERDIAAIEEAVAARAEAEGS
jgi:cytochrome c biogenesis protein CcmG, thiol:disulfide interchange protein DsbE